MGLLGEPERDSAAHALKVPSIFSSRPDRFRRSKRRAARPLRRPPAKMDLKEKMLAEIERRRESLLDQVTLPIGDEMLLRRQLDGVEQALYAGRLPEEDWEQHQFHWLAHCAEQERSLIRRSSHLMLTFEDMERHEPNIFIEDATVLELLHWWREEGGREEYLGQLTIAERRELEEQERQWREKRP